MSVDILQLVPTKIKCLNDGFVRLCDCMPRIVPENRMTCEHAIVLAARVSYDTGLKTVKEDERLITYMYRNKHTSPFEHIKFTFHIRSPIFVARHLNRHRTANINELSQRYTKIKPNFYKPVEATNGIRVSDSINKQSSTLGNINYDLRLELHKKMTKASEEIFEMYDQLIDLGEFNETARSYLPVGTYTEEYFTMDLHNLLKFIKLREDPHAQEETQVFAKAMRKLITPLVPITMQAFLKYEINSIRLNQSDIALIREKRYKSDSKSVSERKEYSDKISKLKLDDNS